VKISDVNQQTIYTCDNIERCQDLYSIRSFSGSDVNKLLKNDLAYFSCHYLDSNFIACVNLAWTNPWDINFLNANNPGYVYSAIYTSEDEEEWDQFGECGKYLAIAWR
jgi:hypothetical protein